jgi:hypothetical protein
MRLNSLSAAQKLGNNTIKKKRACEPLSCFLINRFINYFFVNLIFIIFIYFTKKISGRQSAKVLKTYI